MFMMVDSERKMAVKKSCKYGEYGSFEYLLSLLTLCGLALPQITVLDETTARLFLL